MEPSQASETETELVTETLVEEALRLAAEMEADGVGSGEPSVSVG